MIRFAAGHTAIEVLAMENCMYRYTYILYAYSMREEMACTGVELDISVTIGKGARSSCMSCQFISTVPVQYITL